MGYTVLGWHHEPTQIHCSSLAKADAVLQQQLSRAPEGVPLVQDPGTLFGCNGLVLHTRPEDIVSLFR